MRKESTGSRSESRPEWDQLEEWVRGQVQRLIQELLEEVVTEFLGRAKSARRSDSDHDTGYRNGYASRRRLTLSSGTIQLRRPRVRDTEEAFESRLLPLFVNRTRKVAELIPELYLHGLSEGDFDLALRGLLERGRTGIGEHGGPVEGPSGTMSLPNGAAGPSMTSKWCICGWMESTSRLVLRRRRRRYWW